MTRLPPIGEVKRQAIGTVAVSGGAIALTVTVGFQRTAGLTRRTTDRLQERFDGLLDRFDAETGVSESEPEPESASAVGTEPDPESESDLEREPTPPNQSASPSHWPTTYAEILECGFTPEEYVHDVLSRNDGRLRQRRFVDDYGWAAATISRLLSELEESGRIVRYRLGREKVVCLPEAVPSSHRS